MAEAPGPAIGSAHHKRGERGLVNLQVKCKARRICSAGGEARAPQSFAFIATNWFRKALGIGHPFPSYISTNLNDL